VLGWGAILDSAWGAFCSGVLDVGCCEKVCEGTETGALDGTDTGALDVCGACCGVSFVSATCVVGSFGSCTFSFLAICAGLLFGFQACLDLATFA